MKKLVLSLSLMALMASAAIAGMTQVPVTSDGTWVSLGVGPATVHVQTVNPVYFYHGTVAPLAADTWTFEPTTPSGKRLITYNGTETMYIKVTSTFGVGPVNVIVSK